MIFSKYKIKMILHLPVKLFSKLPLLLLLFLMTMNGIFAQDLDSLKNTDYSNQQRLLIKSELRKALGDRAKSKEIQDLAKNLIPWAMMEGMEPFTFAKNVVLLSEAKSIGIQFETIEDLLPLLSEYKGSETDFLYFSLSVRDAEKSNLPIEYRDQFLSQTIRKKWDGLSTVVGMRILLLSRLEKKPSDSFIPELLKAIPPNLSKYSDERILSIFQSLTSNFRSPSTEKIKSKMENDIVSLRKVKSKFDLNSFQVSQRNLNSDFEEIGAFEFKERPKLQWTIEDLQGTVDEPQKNNDWQYLSIRNLEKVVRSWLGVKYLYGGSSRTGTDCSGFTRNVLSDTLLSVPIKLIPRSARDQAQIGSNVSRTQIQAGDLVFFSASPNQNKITHVGLSMGGDKFAHASTSRGVVIQGLNEKWWTGRFTNARRIFLKVGN